MMSWLALLSFSLFQLKTLSASTPSENRHYFDSSGSGTQEFAEFILSGQVPTETRQFASSSGSSEKRQYVSSGGLGTTESVKGLYGYNGAYGKGTAAGYALTTSSLYYTCQRMVCKSWAVITNHTINNFLLYNDQSGLLYAAEDNGYGTTGYKLDSPSHAVAVQNNLASSGILKTTGSATGYKEGAKGYSAAVEKDIINSDLKEKEAAYSAASGAQASAAKSTAAYDNSQRVVRVYGKLCWQYQCAHKYYHQGVYDYGPNFYAYYGV